MSDITEVLNGAAARKKVRAGVNAVYDNVKLTLGPEGLNALLPRTFNRGPRLTNDGVTVSENIRPGDEHIRLAADFFKEGSKKTNELAGDGTTTTAVIGGSLVNQIFDELEETDTPAAGTNSHKSVRAIRKEMKDMKDEVVGKIKAMATKVQTIEELERIAVISIGKEDEEVARIIARLVWEVARDEDGEFVDNHVDVTEGYKGEIETEIIKGMRFPSKVAHRAFVNKPERFEMEAMDTPVLITNLSMDNQFEVIGLINKLIEQTQISKLAIFAPHFSPSVIQSLVATTKNGFHCFPIHCPALRTEQMEDLALYTGATVVDKDNNRTLKTVVSANLGFAEKIVVKAAENKEDAILLGGRGAKDNKEGIAERIGVLKEQLKEAKNELTTATVQKRIANLQSAIGVVRVGASTNAELLYLKLKIEDGVFACKAALEEGFVPGGGLCLHTISEELEEGILTQALRAPYEQIQRNAGGYLEIEDTVIDPAKVVRMAIEHGVSVASSMITTGIVVPELREKDAYEGSMQIAKAVGKIAYYDAKHKSLLQDAEDEAEAEREAAFEQALFDAERD